MKNLFFYCLIFMAHSSLGQITFNSKIPVEDIGVLPYFNNNFGGLSGIEYNFEAKEWILVSDRCHFFTFKDCKSVADFQKWQNMKGDSSTKNYFESVRYDSLNKTYFYSTEKKDSTSVYFGDLSGKKIKHLNSFPIILPSGNKGVEAITLTPSGALWVAPEAGWKNELTTQTIHFLRYKKPFSNEKPEYFNYEIMRFPKATNKKEDTVGGIAEMLAIDDTHLLVLERCYIDPKVKAYLYNVKIDTTNKKLIKENIAFNFNDSKNGIDTLCNIEGMCWGDKEKKTLYIIADDNLVNRNGNANIPTLRNQLIILRKQE